METSYTTEELIKELTAATCGAAASVRDKQVFTEALRSLVRLAKAEQMLDLRTNIRTLNKVPPATLHSHWEVD